MNNLAKGEWGGTKLGARRGKETQRHRGTPIPARAAVRLNLDFKYSTAAVLVAVGYYLGAKFGFALTLQPRPVSILWAPNAILMAGLILTPRRAWSILLLAAVPAHWTAQLQTGVPFPMILGWFVSNSFEAILGALCVRRWVGPRLDLDNFRNLGVFMAATVFVAPFVSSFLDAAFVRLNQWGQSSYAEIWSTRFFSNALAAMMLVPLAVSWSKVRLASFAAARRLQLLEAAFLAVALLTIGYFVFILPAAGPDRQPALLYAPLPILLWAAARFGVVGTSTLILFLGWLAIFGTARGRGPFASNSPLENALSVQVFLILSAIPLLYFAAALRQRHRIEEELRRSEARYREVVESQTDLICRFLPDTTLTFVNEAYCRFLQRNRKELLGVKFLQFIPEAARAAILAHIKSLLKNPRIEPVEHEVVMPDGTHVWHRWTNHVIRDADGKVVEFQAIGHDISDRKRAAEANEKLAHVSRLTIVGELAASIVHQIRQPLGAILTNTEAAELLLEAETADLEEVRRILADIRKDDERASEVVRHIRNLFRKRQLELRPLDVNTIVEDVLHFVGFETRRRKVTVRADLAPSGHLVHGDRIELQQVLLNLIMNAMDAMDDTPEGLERLLTVRTAAHESFGMEVTVSDSGTGVCAERLSTLFDSFVTTKPEGMGLGLSISRAIVEAHHGKIWCRNNPDRGATFGFVLPSHVTNSSVRKPMEVTHGHHHTIDDTAHDLHRG